MRTRLVRRRLMMVEVPGGRCRAASTSQRTWLGLGLGLGLRLGLSLGLGLGLGLGLWLGLGLGLGSGSRAPRGTPRRRRAPS